MKFGSSLCFCYHSGSFRGHEQIAVHVCVALLSSCQLGKGDLVAGLLLIVVLLPPSSFLRTKCDFSTSHLADPRLIATTLCFAQLCSVITSDSTRYNHSFRVSSLQYFRGISTSHRRCRPMGRDHSAGNMSNHYFIYH